MSTETLQGALRMLYLLDKAGTLVAPGGTAQPADAVAVIDSEMKLQALHFWMRNPDYLAYEILDRVEKGTTRRRIGVDRAEHLLGEDEPSLRRYPMLRCHFGAYEPIDVSLAILAAPGLARRVRHGSPGQRQSGPRSTCWKPGRELADEDRRRPYPELRWYPERAGIDRTK